MKSHERVGWLSIGLLLASISVAKAVDVDQCAQRLEIPPGETAVLTQDISCGHFCDDDPSQPCDPNDEAPCGPGGICVGESLFLGDGAELDLNGHTITAAHQLTPVHCGLDGERGSCSIVGPGTIECDHGGGIAGQQMHVVVRDGVTVEHCDYGIGSARRVLVRDSEVRACEIGIAGRRVRVEDVTLQNESWDIRATDSVRVDRVTFGGSGAAIESGGGVSGTDLTALGGTIYARHVRLARFNSTAGATSFGLVIQGRPILKDSAVTSHIEADIVSGKKPILIDSTCDTSEQLAAPGTSWGICSGD